MQRTGFTKLIVHYFTEKKLKVLYEIDARNILSFSSRQSDQIGRFLQVLGNNLSHQSSPEILVTFGLFLIMSLLFKKCVATFGAIFGGIRQLIIPSCGHTGSRSFIL